MRSRDQILAEVLDSLIRQDDCKIPPEVGEMVQVGLRLYNECPNIDAEFMEGLGRQLEKAWVPAGRPSRLSRLETLLRSVAVWRGLATAAITIGLFVLCAVAFPGLRSQVEASLSRTISLFERTEIEQRPHPNATPWPTPEVERHLTSLAEARAAAGFELRVPSYLPNGLEFQGADLMASQGRRWAVLRYAGSDDVARAGRGLQQALIQEFATGEAPERLADSLQIGLESAERLQLAGRPALWVAGNWGPTGRWTRGGQSGMVMVQDGDLFLLVYSSLGREESVRMALSLLR